MSEERKSRYELFLEEQGAPKTKQCSKCKVFKLPNEFIKRKDTVSGLTSWCKQCANEKHRKYKNDVDRFWKEFWGKVKRVDDCLEWQGRCNSGGCPIRSWRGKKNASVRRIVYELALGEAPEDMFVIRTCKNHRCVSQHHMKLASADELNSKRHDALPVGDRHPARARPDYLKRGDLHWARIQPEKWADIRSRSKATRGEQHAAAKLTEASVRRARNWYNNGETVSSIARTLRVDRKTIRSAIQGITWKHVDAHEP